MHCGQACKKLCCELVPPINRGGGFNPMIATKLSHLTAREKRAGEKI